MQTQCFLLAGAAIIAAACAGSTVTEGGGGGQGGIGGSSTATGMGGQSSSAGPGGGSPTSSSTTASSGSGGGCLPACDIGLACCAGQCVNLQNDILNCGACGQQCMGQNPYCNYGTCEQPPCSGTVCSGITFCCGMKCCAIGQLCCAVQGPGPSGGPDCYDPTPQGTCPVGCPLCQ